MKKYTCLLLALVMCLSLAACVHNGPDDPDIGGTDWRTTAFYYDTEDQVLFGSVDYPITLEGGAWEMFKEIDFADRNGDGSSDAAMNTERCTYLYGIKAPLDAAAELKSVCQDIFAGLHLSNGE